MKVLLAEDSRTNQIMIRTYIEEAGHEIVIANNGQQAIEMFIEIQPDLVLMDIIMPVVDGIEAAKEIRKVCARDDDWAPIIFLSAMSDAKHIESAIDAGGDDYLTKPVDSVVLNAKLRAMERIADMRQELKKANLELRMMSVKDGLTGIANRRHFDDVLAREVKRAMRSNSPLSLAICDIDFFKPYNDNYGHQAGDDCLKYVAVTMERTSKRPGDVVARYGGEEFGIILPDTTREGAVALVDIVRVAVENLELTHDYSMASKNVTISAGVATIQPAKSDNLKDVARKLVQAADIALYFAKERGRNQVVAEQSELLDEVATKPVQ